MNGCFKTLYKVKSTDSHNKIMLCGLENICDKNLNDFCESIAANYKTVSTETLKFLWLNKDSGLLQTKCNRNNETITLTFGEIIENHVGMEKIGTSRKGYAYEELKSIHEKFSDTTEFVKLHKWLKNENSIKGCVLIFRNFLAINNIDHQELFSELSILPMDKKYYCSRRKKVLNKNARWNLCFDDTSRNSDYENKKGTIISFDDLKQMGRIRQVLPLFFGEKSFKLKCELNYYYNNKTGIGFHGDTERNIVIGIRLGETIPLVFAWFHKAKPISEKIELKLNAGDLYIFSEKAVGNDWKKRNLITLRHAAGCDKYTKLL